MKIAVCIGGLPRGNYQQITEHLYNIFGKKLGADFYFSYWKGRGKPKITIPHKGLYEFNEPKATYHFVMDTEEELFPENVHQRNWRKYNIDNHKPNNISQASGYFQILNHAYFLQKLPKEYDMIIKARYDIATSIIR